MVSNTHLNITRQYQELHVCLFFSSITQVCLFLWTKAPQVCSSFHRGSRLGNVGCCDANIGKKKMHDNKRLKKSSPVPFFVSGALLFASTSTRSLIRSLTKVLFKYFFALWLIMSLQKAMKHFQFRSKANLRCIHFDLPTTVGRQYGDQRYSTLAHIVSLSLPSWNSFLQRVDNKCLCSVSSSTTACLWRCNKCAAYLLTRLKKECMSVLHQCQKPKSLKDCLEEKKKKKKFV